jgi:hypothetical protein
MSVVSTLSCSFAAAAPGSDVRLPVPPELARARFVDVMGVEATLVLEPSPEVFPQLTVIRAVRDRPLASPAVLLLPYSDDLVADWNIQDEHTLGVFTDDGTGTWSWSPANVDANTNTVYVGVESGEAWAAGPPWMMRAWQRRVIMGEDFVAGERNVLVIHGWNSDPWEGCMLDLMAGIAPLYDNVAAMAYPSALDIAANGNWLREQIEQRWPDTSIDIIGFSEGGLVARAAIEPHTWNGSGSLSARVGRLVTIATPHTGVLPEAKFSVLNDEAARQMRHGSALLRELNTHTSHAGVRYEFIGGDTGAGHDGIVPLPSAFGRGTLAPDETVTLTLPHSAVGGSRGLPCDTAVYDAIGGRR